MKMEVDEEKLHGALNVEQPANWWDAEDVIITAPWWARYPAGVLALASAYFVFVWADQAALNNAAQWFIQWVFGGILVLVGLVLIRELFVFILGIIALWWLGTVAVANPIPAAIILGAYIIAKAR